MMEEVDNIIIHSLREIGCDIEDGVTNLSSFDTELVVEATVRCLDAIRPGLGLLTILPSNMAARFRLGASLAQICMDLGYKGDIGYQTFLYSSENDLRRVFMFLIEKLPKESDKTLSKPTSEVALLEKSVASIVSQSLSVPWLPHFCHVKGLRNRGRASVPYRSVNIEVPITNDGKEYQEYYIHYLQSVPNQMQNYQHFLPSVVSYNAKALRLQSINVKECIDWLNNQQFEKVTRPADYFSNNIFRFTQKDRMQLKIATDTRTGEQSARTTLPREEILNKEEEDLQVEKIKEQCDELRLELNTLQDEMKKLTAKVTQTAFSYQNERKEFKLVEQQTQFKGRVYRLCQDEENSTEDLENEIENSKSKLINLANSWETHRINLIKMYRHEREKHSTKANATQKKQEEIKVLKEKEKELEEEYRNKDQLFSQLTIEVQKLPKEVNRSAYTQRILEIIHNVRKQREEINKVLADTREIQKEINTLTGRLERSFTVVDELIFRDARTNEASRKAYKLLATLHSDCNELVSLVEETGATIREIRDLEEQIDTESAKNVGANLERITADLKQMKQETAALTAQIQSKNS